MSAKRDYSQEIGRKFGRYTVIGVIAGYPTRVSAECECGKVNTLVATQLVNGYTKSCGCYMIDSKTRHGLFGTRFYRIWDSIKKRCENKKHVHYNRYGGSGITCDFKDFIDFRDKMYTAYLDHVDEFGEKDTSIDRIDSSKGYSSNNCRRTTRIEQNNHKEVNVFYECNGEKLTAPQIARKYKINLSTLKSRMRRGRSLEKALATNYRLL